MLKELDRAWIAGHIPHRGSMCLLDAVEAWDQERIECRASSHRAVDNPLRAQGRLGAACGIEYAAQAMAVHGALLAPPAGSPRVGYLVSVRSTRLHVPRLDDIAADLRVEAACITRSENQVLYRFSVGAAGRVLIDGRAAVVLDAAELAPRLKPMPAPAAGEAP
ncbi:MAG TPA: 3-hydroxylacyl-ACP dehydratase [Rhodocyclaceae bacterium]|nr:3-hydroxylacyl-ACP dehydratase [Rhodocyclaceae bacterium]